MYKVIRIKQARPDARPAILMRENVLLKRTFEFGVSCLKYLRKLEENLENNLIRYQLGK